MSQPLPSFFSQYDWLRTEEDVQLRGSGGANLYTWCTEILVGKCRTIISSKQSDGVGAQLLSSSRLPSSLLREFLGTNLFLFSSSSVLIAKIYINALNNFCCDWGFWILTPIAVLYRFNVFFVFGRGIFPFCNA